MFKKFFTLSILSVDVDSINLTRVITTSFNSLGIEDGEGKLFSMSFVKLMPVLYLEAE